MSIKTEIELDPSKAVDQAGKAADAIGDKLSRARVWSDDLVKTATAKGAAIGGNAGFGLQKVAQFADDAQYGLKGVTNNISDTLMALGAGAGLAGAATIAAVAVQTVLVPALEKLAMGETEAERTARLQAAAELDAAQAKRRLAVETKIAEKTHKDWETRLASSISTVREINTAVSESISRTQKWNELKAANAKTKIEAEDMPEIERIKKIADAEAAAMVEKNRLDRVSAQTTAGNINKEYDAQQKLYNETARAIGIATQKKALLRKQSDALAGDKNTESQRKDLEVQAEAFEREIAGLVAKKEELSKSLAAIKSERSQANKAYEQAIDEQKMLDLRLETNSIQAQQKITKILEQTAKERKEAFEKIAEIGQGMSKKGMGADAKNTKNMEEERNQAASRKAFDAELEIQALQSRGHDRQAEKLKKELEIQKQTQDLIKMGFSEKDAASRAKKESDLKEDADFRKRTGRSRFHGVKGQVSFQGISNGNEYGGLNYLDMGRDRFGSRRVGDASFGRLDKMEAMQNDPRRNQPKSTVVDAPAKPVAPPGVAELAKALESLNSTLVPALKKYAAEPLAKNS